MLGALPHMAWIYQHLNSLLIHILTPQKYELVGGLQRLAKYRLSFKFAHVVCVLGLGVVRSPSLARH